MIGPNFVLIVSLLSFSFLFAEEEIDVVSVGDKNLPNNPSARDRRALQNKITSRMVKTTTHTIPRRRISNGSSGDSAYGSKNSPEIASPNAGGSPIRFVTSNGSRKRAGQAAAAGAVDALSPIAKRSKLNKQPKNISSPPSGRVSLNATPVRRNHISTEVNEEIDTIEKRNLHNDMERQRRIGLKNLFENLKDKIPSLCEKERAPKVNILREATILCTKLTQEDREYEQQLKRRHRLQQRLKYLREQLAARGQY